MNPFAALELPERASLSSEEVKERFVQLSALHHPDRTATPAASRDRFTQINQAFGQLQSPGGRLKALLETRFPDSFALKGTLPDGMLTLFSEIGSALQAADAYLAKKAKATTGLAEALLAPALLHVQASLGQAAARVAERLSAIEARLPELDALVETDGGTAALQDASLICRELLYLEKWQSQIQGRFHQLL